MRVYVYVIDLKLDVVCAVHNTCYGPNANTQFGPNTLCMTVYGIGITLG